MFKKYKTLLLFQIVLQVDRTRFYGSVQLGKKVYFLVRKKSIQIYSKFKFLFLVFAFVGNSGKQL